MKRQDGFSLVELMIAITLMLLVLGTTLVAFSTFQRTNEKAQSQNDSQQQARAALDQLAHDLRTAAAPAADTPRGFATATDTDVVFQTVDTTGASGGSNVRHAEWVRYCLDSSVPGNEVLWRQTLTWTTATSPTAPISTVCPDNGAGSGWGNSRQQVADHIVNYSGQSKPLFYFYPSPLNSPPSTADLGRIQRIRVDMFVNYDSRRTPTPTELDTGVYLRDAIQSPTAAFTVAPPSGSGSVYLNASSSSDPGGFPLTYQWCDTTAGGGCSATTNSIGQGQTFQYSAASGSTRTITLVVTDSAGGTDTVSQQVSIP